MIDVFSRTKAENPKKRSSSHRVVFSVSFTWRVLELGVHAN